MLTKAEEKKMFTKVIDKMPEGYVRTILQDIKMEVERAIDDDFGFIMFAERRREIEEHRAEMTVNWAKLNSLKLEIADLERKRNVLMNGVEEVRATVRQLARI